MLRSISICAIMWRCSTSASLTSVPKTRLSTSLNRNRKRNPVKMRQVANRNRGQRYTNGTKNPCYGARPHSPKPSTRPSPENIHPPVTCSHHQPDHFQVEECPYKIRAPICSYPGRKSQDQSPCVDRTEMRSRGHVVSQFQVDWTLGCSLPALQHQHLAARASPISPEALDMAVGVTILGSDEGDEA